MTTTEATAEANPARRLRCCYVHESGAACGHPASVVLLGRQYDDFTHACAVHAEDLADWDNFTTAALLTPDGEPGAAVEFSDLRTPERRPNPNRLHLIYDGDRAVGIYAPWWVVAVIGALCAGWATLRLAGLLPSTGV